MRRSFVVTAVLGLWLGSAVCAPRAESQPSRPHVGLIARGRVPSALRNDVRDLLRTDHDVTLLGTNARAKPVQALRKRIDAADVTLVILVDRPGRWLILTYFEPRTGERLGRDRMYMSSPRLSAKLKQRLIDAVAVQLAAATTSAADPLAGAQAEEDGEDRGSASEPGAPGMSASDDEPAEDSSAEETAIVGEESFSEPATSVTEEEGARAVALRLGIGTSSYSAELDESSGRSRFDAGTALAIGTGAQLTLRGAEGPGWTFYAHYTTSLERKVRELHVAGPPQPMSLRTHRLEGGLGPVFSLGGAPWWLSVTLGYALRSVAPEVHFQLLPFYTLGGPYLRAELKTPAIANRVGLRVSPELHWLVQASRRVGGAGASGTRLAWGGELAVFCHLTSAFAVEMSLHQSYGHVAGTGTAIDDSQRFALASLVWSP